MCGIAGFYGFRDDRLIKKISLELEHRGPDGEGYDIDDQVTLLNRRLAIIDRKGGAQPIFNEDKSISIVYVGEIYNFQELSSELVAKGHIFKTKCDTEMVIHAYEEWGVQSFDRFNGMFTFALHDKKKGKLILARDHFGIKPLYFSTVDSNKFIFSSEIKPIIYSGLVKREANDRVIYRYLKYRVHDEGRETFFKNVFRLLPGEVVEIQSRQGGTNIKFQKYTNLENELIALSQRSSVHRKDDKEATETGKFKEKLIEAIKLRLISEVPVGSCLSGGLDSSTVVAVVNQLLQKKVKETQSVGRVQNTFSAVFPNSSNNEEKYIDELLKTQKMEIKSHKVIPNPDEFFQKDIEDFVQTQEEPTISTGPYAQYKVMQMAHRKVTVVLDGQGADEILAGYLPYYYVYLRQLLKEKRYLVFMREFITSIDILFVQSINRLKIQLGIKKTTAVDSLLRKSFNSEFNRESFDPINDNLKKRLIEDVFKNSLQSLLRYEDRNAMRFSIEGRVPFLDFNLIRYIFSLDTDAIIKNGWNKKILRDATDTILPNLINKRRNKIGFTTPEHEWFMRMKNRIYSIFLSESFSKRNYFSQSEVLKSFQDFIAGKIDDTMVFWRILNLELWMREFIDSKKNNELETTVYEFGKANKGKKLELRVGKKTYYRFPIKTELFQKGDDWSKKISEKVYRFIDKSIHEEKYKNMVKSKFFIVVSEKIVAIAQGRAHFIWEIRPSFLATVLSKFVTKTPAGIGLGSPWTMQLAIEEDGFLRILFASAFAFITKPFGIRGMFYRLVSDSVASIDGPTEYSLYPSNVSAKLGPKDPQVAAKKIHAAISNFKLLISNFQGVVIIDANDLGQKVLGNTTRLPDHLVESVFKDNPMGQSSEQTPITLVNY